MSDMNGYYANEQAQARAREEEAKLERLKLMVKYPKVDMLMKIAPGIGASMVGIVVCLWLASTCTLHNERMHERTVQSVEAHREVGLATAEAHKIHGFVTTEGAPVIGVKPVEEGE